MTRSFALLDDRSVIHLHGPDTEAFLQDLITNDVRKVTSGGAVYAALLTPQGKYLHDFFVFPLDGGLALDAEAARSGDLVRRLSMYRLRAKVAIEDVSDRRAVAALWGEAAADDMPAAAAVYADPRLEALGWRAVLEPGEAEVALAAAGWAQAHASDYERLRVGLGVPDGSRDLIVDKSFLLEGNFEELNGVDFNKGCYVGQENTTRQKRRGVVRKRLMRVDIAGPAPAPGTPIMLGEREAGTMRSSAGAAGIALLRLEHVGRAAESGEALRAGEARLTPVKPDWASY